jgi:hypothetical protein
MQYCISKTKAAFNPANTNTPDTFVSRGYDTREGESGFSDHAV